MRGLGKHRMGLGQHFAESDLGGTRLLLGIGEIAAGECKFTERVEGFCPQSWFMESCQWAQLFPGSVQAPFSQGQSRKQKAILWRVGSECAKPVEGFCCRGNPGILKMQASRQTLEPD